MASSTSLRIGPLLKQLAWFARLRWFAGAGVIVATLIEARWLGWYPNPHRGLAIGAFVLAYNAALSVILKRRQWTEWSLLVLSGVQIFLDMACLTCLTLCTGGMDSPLRGFFVFHMVFASLLLPRPMAYA